MTDKKTASPEEKSAIINWDAVHRRLAEMGAAIDKNWTPGPAEQRKILRARARAMAWEAPAGAAGERIESVEFLLGYENYGIETCWVREIHPLKELTPLPCVPAFVLGIVNIRGQILTVIDIRKFFELPEKGLSDLNKVIVVRARDMEIGILADAILGVRSIPRREIQASLPTLTGIREDYLMGITKERVVILDAARLLADEKIIVQQEV